MMKHEFLSLWLGFGADMICCVRFFPVFFSSRMHTLEILEDIALLLLIYLYVN